MSFFFMELYQYQRKYMEKYEENWGKTVGNPYAKEAGITAHRKFFVKKEQNLLMISCSQNEEAKESARIQLPGTHGRHGIQKAEEFK